MPRGKGIVLKKDRDVEHNVLVNIQPTNLQDQCASIQYEKWLREHNEQLAGECRLKQKLRRQQAFKFLHCNREVY